MNFQDLPLAEAVYTVYQRTDKPGEDDWIQSRRLDICAEVYKELMIELGDDNPFPYTVNEICNMWLYLRKGTDRRMLVEICKLRGRFCFFDGRGKGDCSSHAVLTLLCPEERGGELCVENAVLVCDFHRKDRGAQSIEAYLANGHLL